MKHLDRITERIKALTSVERRNRKMLADMEAEVERQATARNHEVVVGVLDEMGKRSKRKKRAERSAAQQRHRKLQSLFAHGKLYLNMDSKEWQTGIVDGVDIRGLCCGYRVPRGTTPEEEKKMVAKWHEIDAILCKDQIDALHRRLGIKSDPKQPKPQVKKAAPAIANGVPQKLRQSKKDRKKKKELKLKIAQVELELVGTEL